ncbi:DUF3375 family protein [Streptomyces sp. NBC_01483]|uniref:DUF3375 family protein n=1 Tax=Streptomyces sp. NBC_01483 TaxID=2903883 RepID=UPI002E332650|nr:DUF3375 family protein [Streptomyces sp. NBC_01483]
MTVLGDQLGTGAPIRQDELKTLPAEVEVMESIGEPAPRMRRMPRDWLEAAEPTQAVVRQLSDQLRRFLDDQVRAEDRRVLEFVRMPGQGTAVPPWTSGRPPRDRWVPAAIARPGGRRLPATGVLS